MIAMWWILGCAFQAPESPATPSPPPQQGTYAAVDGPLKGPRYTLSFPDRNAQYVDVEAVFPSGDADELELMIPTWTPGSYLIREYAQHLVDLSASGSEGPLEAEKTSKNRWRVDPKGSDYVRLAYKVWSTEATVRTNLVTQDMAILNGAPTFVTMVDGLDLPHDVRIVRPSDWASVETALPLHPDNSPDHYQAIDADMLYDSPVFVGNPTTRRFEVDGVEHRIAMLPNGELWDHDRASADIQRIVETQIAFWRSLPYPNYLFLNALVDARGGLEHSASTLMMANQDQMLDEVAYKKWLGLVSHEFFHTWNVKRLRPVSLGPFDYENEAYTRDLWVVEGITSYYDDLLMARADLLTEEEYIGRLSDQIKALHSTPGRLHQSLADASFDAWIEHYRRDENSKNTAISYYTKGAVVAFALDAEIRERTDGRGSLDDVMREAYARYSDDVGYTTEQWRAIASEVAGQDLTKWFHAVVDTPSEVPLQKAAEWFGLTVDTSAPSDEPYAGWALGSGQRVVRVQHDGPAWKSGVQLGDEVLAVNGWRLPSQGLDGLNDRLKAGEEVDVVLTRLGKLRTVRLTLGVPPTDTTLTTNAKATGAAKKRRNAWLAGEP